MVVIWRVVHVLLVIYYTLEFVVLYFAHKKVANFKMYTCISANHLLLNIHGRDVAIAIISHPNTWKKFMRLCVPGNNGQIFTPMRMLIQHMPGV